MLYWEDSEGQWSYTGTVWRFWLVAGEGPLPGSQTTIFSLYAQDTGSKLSCVSSYKGTNATHEGSTFMTYLPPKGPISE